MDTVTGEQVDGAAEIIMGWVRAWQAGEIRSGSLDDACVNAACEVRDLWGLGFQCEDPQLCKAPRTQGSLTLVS